MKSNNLKVCLYLQNPAFYRGSGIGQALNHQKKALELNNIDYTLDPNDSDYQILHINSHLPGILGVIRKARNNGKKIILHAHMTSEDFKKSFIFSNLMAPIVHWWLDILYSKADVIICPSPYTYDILKKNYKRLRDKKIIPISNGIDINKWKYDKKGADKFKLEYNLKEPIIFSVGLIFVRKGVIDFIKISRKMPDLSFVWIGRNLKKLIANNELEKELKNKPENFLSTGYVNDIVGAYSSGDILFFPSHEENEGITVLEAAAMGKAIVVRDIPVFNSYMKNGVHCLMGKTNEEFMEKINLLLKDKKLREKLSKNARKLAKSKSLKIIGSQLKEVYLDILKDA